MKLTIFLTAATLAHVGLASAIPTQAHERIHNQRRDSVAPVVETIYTTFYQTIIWVDGNGNTVSTEINTPPVGAATAVPSVSDPATAAGTLANLAAFKSRSSGLQASRSDSIPASKPTVKPSDIPSSANAPASGNIENTGSTNTGDVAPGGMGICYDMIDSATRCKNSGTIASEFGFLRSQGYGIVRIYDIGCPIGDFVAGAAQIGLKLMIGTNDIEQSDLLKLIEMVNGNWSPVDTVYVGNERVNGGLRSAADVAGAVSAARGTLAAAGFHGNVVTVDTFNMMQNDPTICSTSDYCATNIHAFFDPNTAASGAGAFVINAYNSVVKTSGGKRVVVTESGWPWQGSCNGQACPSIENQRTAMNSVMSSFAGMPSQLFLFQAYNAGYKPAGSFGVEQFFGIFDSDHYAPGTIGA